MDFDYELTIPGNPRPQGRPRTRIITPKFGKAFATIYEDGKDKRAKVHIQSNVRSQAPAEPLTGPLEVELWFYLPRPQGNYGTGRNAGQLKASAAKFHIKKPDSDNCEKLLLDALTGIFWNDDSQICDTHIHKRYSKTPRTVVHIAKIKQEGLFECG